jgi:2-polyprenyl-3-methyl-5-hydroxy-6-metoxy-1,4-benzoquinol methylase
MRPRRLFRLILRRTRATTGELSTPEIRRAILCAIEHSAPPILSGDYLDVGSGTGRLLQLIVARYGVRSFACDYTDRLMRVQGQPVDIVDLNHDPLPYADNRFALVTCAETIEHLEHYRETLREIYRVLKPGGTAVISTPNVLNLRSRLHYLTFGFPSLFGPLAVGEQDVHSPRGHINHVGWFYLAHAILDARFVDLKLSVDHYQRRSFISLAFLFLPIRLAALYGYHRELRKYRTINAQNEWAVRKINSRDIMLGRTLIVTARKPQ